MTDLDLRTLTISNFRSIGGSISIPLNAPVVLIHGANGAGKSTLLSALELALTGDVSGIEAPDRQYLVHRGAQRGEVDLVTATEHVAIVIDGPHAAGAPLLSGDDARFFVERSHLQQRALSRLLEVYEGASAGGQGQSPLTAFVNELLGLDEAEALIEGPYAVTDKRRVKRLLPAYNDIEREAAARTKANSDREDDLAKVIAGRVAARSQLEQHLDVLGAPAIARGDDELTATWLSDAGGADERTLTGLVGARRELQSLTARIQSLPHTAASDHVDALEALAATARAAAARWRTIYAEAFEELLDRARVVLPGTPAWGGAANPSAIAQSVRTDLDTELSRLKAQLATSERASVELHTSNQVLTVARRRLDGLNEQLTSSSTPAAAEALAASLAALLPHVDGDDCPACGRNYGEISSEPLSAQIAAHISELTGHASRLKELANARVEATAAIQQIEVGRETQTRRRIPDEEQEVIRTRVAELDVLAQLLAGLEPGLGEGASLIRAEIETSRNAAGVRELDRDRAELRSVLIQMADSLAVVSSDGTPPGVLLEALVEAVASQIQLTQAGVERRRLAVAALEVLHKSGEDQARIQRMIEKENTALASMQQATDELDRRRSLARKLRAQVEQARTDMVRQVFTTSLNRVWQDLFTRLVPDEPFVPSFRLPEGGGSVVASLETIHRDGAPGGRPAAMLSAGNLNTAALTLFLALNLSVKPQLPWILLDDPVQSMDEVHISQFAALLRTLTRDHGRRVVIAVHERPLFEYLSLELSPSNAREGLVSVELSRDADGRTSADPSFATYQEDGAFRLA